MRAVGYLVGAGSMSLGIEAAGFELERPWETPGYSRNAKNWDLNRPRHRHLVMELDERKPFPGADLDELDLVYGNPPCGGLSSITGSQSSSGTNRHMVAWMKMVLATRPRAVLMENAGNLAAASGAPIRDELAGILESAGYSHCVWQFWSWQLGTPQKRRRSFLAAVRDQSVPAWFVDLGQVPREPEGRSWVRNHICDLARVAPTPDPVVADNGPTTMHYWDERGREVQRLIELHWPRFEYAYIRNARIGKTTDDLSWMPENWRTAWITRLPRRVASDGPAPAVISDYVLVHYDELRLLTMRELARLMGYPDSWMFKSYRPAWVAQGVPVWNATWAARRVKELLGGSAHG